MMLKTLCLSLLSALLPCAAAAQWRADDVGNVLQHAPMAATLVLKACGAKGSPSWTALAQRALPSYVLAAGTAYALKHSVHELRPDHTDRHAFPSGHATFAFAGATVLHHEYGHLSPWVTVGGYATALLVGLDRVRQDRHYLHDVCAGAALGTLSAELTYWLNRRLQARHLDVAVSPTQLQLALSF